MTSSSKLILGYWSIRGLGHPIRLLLHHLGIQFTERRYSTEEYGSEWYQEKYSLGLTFPNLPYLITEDGSSLKLTQSLAIMAYIARKYDPTYAGQTEAEQIAIDQLSFQLIDFISTFSNVVYERNPEKFDLLHEAFTERQLPQALGQLEYYLGDRKYAICDRLTYIDFYLYEYLVKMKIYDETSFVKFPKLVEYVERFEAIPSVKQYYSEEGPLPFCTPWAKWNAVY